MNEYCLDSENGPVCKSQDQSWSFYKKEWGTCGADTVTSLEMCQAIANEQGTTNRFDDYVYNLRFAYEKPDMAPGCQWSDTYGWQFNFPDSTTGCSSDNVCICQDSSKSVVPKYCLAITEQNLNSCTCGTKGPNTITCQAGEYCLDSENGPVCKSQDQSWSFYKKETGTCGLDTVNSLGMCQAIAGQPEAIRRFSDLTKNLQDGRRDPGMPPGCQYRAVYGWRLNYPDSTIACSSEHQCICQDSSAPVVRKYCLGSSEPNASPCTCGTGDSAITCQAGEYCLDSENGPICKSQDQSWSFYKKEWGTCGDDTVTSLEMCQAIADQPEAISMFSDFSDNNHRIWNYDNQPPGCQYSAAYGWQFNKLTSTGTCSSDNACICQDSSAPVGLNNQCLGPSEQNVNSCICGGPNGITCEANDSCLDSENGPVCKSQDQSWSFYTKETGTCGADNVTSLEMCQLIADQPVAISRFSDFATNLNRIWAYDNKPPGCQYSPMYGWQINQLTSTETCSSDNACICQDSSNTIVPNYCLGSSEPNDDPCTCGTKGPNTITCQAGEYCLDSENGPVCGGVSFYIKESGTCGADAITSLEMCQAIANRPEAISRFSDYTAYLETGSDEDWLPPGCQWSDDFGWDFNKPETISDCNYFYKCICQDRLRPVAVDYCLDDNQKNIIPCTCGTKGPNAITCQPDDYCFDYDSGPECGSAPQSLPFYTKQTGTCGDDTVTSLEMCQAIANEPGTMNRFSSFMNNLQIQRTDDTIPPGCLYSVGYGWRLNYPDSPTVCSSDNVCICQDSSKSVVRVELSNCLGDIQENTIQCTCGTGASAITCGVNEYCYDNNEYGPVCKSQDQSWSFYTKETGTCGPDTVTSPEMCQAIAEQPVAINRFSDITELFDPAAEWFFLPPGCQWSADLGWEFNYPDSQTDCSSDKQCICQYSLRPVILSCRVSSEQNASPCSCGTNTITIYNLWNSITCQAGEYCHDNDSGPVCADQPQCRAPSEENASPCICGTGASAITCQAGEYCYDGVTPVCLPACKYTNGLFPNEEDCQCGNYACAMPKSPVWEFASRASSCSEYGEVMTTEEECKQYATINSLTFGGTLNQTSSPYGCIQSKNDMTRVVFNIEQSSAVICSDAYPCICKSFVSADAGCLESDGGQGCWKFSKSIQGGHAERSESLLPSGCNILRPHPFTSEADVSTVFNTKGGDDIANCAFGDCSEICTSTTINKMLGNYCVEKESLCISKGFFHERNDIWANKCEINQEAKLRCHCGDNICEAGQFCLPDGTCKLIGECPTGIGLSHSQCTCGHSTEICNSLYYESIDPCPAEDRITTAEECERARQYFQGKTSYWANTERFEENGKDFMPSGCVGLIFPTIDSLNNYVVVWYDESNTRTCKDSFRCNSHICKKSEVSTNEIEPFCKITNDGGMCQAAYDCENNQGALYNPNVVYPFAKNQCLCHSGDIEDICESALTMDIEQCERIPTEKEVCEATSRSHGLKWGGELRQSEPSIPPGCVLLVNQKVVFNPSVNSGGSTVKCVDSFLCLGHVCADTCPYDGNLTSVSSLTACEEKANGNGILFEVIANPGHALGCIMDYDLNRMAYNTFEIEDTITKFSTNQHCGKGALGEYVHLTKDECDKYAIEDPENIKANGEPRNPNGARYEAGRTDFQGGCSYHGHYGYFWNALTTSTGGRHRPLCMIRDIADIDCVGDCSRHVCKRPEEKAFCDIDGKCYNTKQREPPCGFGEGNHYNPDECACGKDTCRSAIRAIGATCKNQPMTIEECKTASTTAGILFLGILGKDYGLDYEADRMAKYPPGCSLAGLIINGNYGVHGLWNPNANSTAVCGEESVCKGHLCMQENCKKLPQTKDDCEKFAMDNGLDFAVKYVSEYFGEVKGCVFEPYYKNFDKVTNPWILWYDNQYDELVCGEDRTYDACRNRDYCLPPEQKAFCNREYGICSNVWNPSCTDATTVQIEPSEECPQGYEEISSAKDCAKFAEQTEIMIVEYSLRETGTCEDGGGTIITDHEECTLAAFELGKSKDLKTAGIVNDAGSPPGCLFNPSWGTGSAPQFNNPQFNNPQFNNIGEQECGANGYHCICKKLTVNPDETYTYGNIFSLGSYNDGCLLVDNKAYYNDISISNYEHHKTRRLCAVEPEPEGCQCAENVCRAGARFCEFEQCTQERACNHIDGQIENSEIDCLCGQAMCTDTTGFFCSASENRCAKGPPCANTKGQDPNEQCLCGDNTCESGEYCYIPEDNSPMEIPSVNKGGNPTTHYLLSLCEGDCDNDDQCEEGLKCHQRDNGEPTPGCDHDSAVPPLHDFCYDPTALSQTKAVCSTERNRVGEIDICSFNYVEKNNNKCYCGGNICSADEPYCLHSESSCSSEVNRPPCQENQPLDECECSANNAEYCPINGKALCGSDGKCKFPDNCDHTGGQFANTVFCRCAADGSAPTSDASNCDDNRPYCGPSANGHLICTAKPTCDTDVKKTTVPCSCEINGEFVTCAVGQYCNRQVGKCTAEIPCENTDGMVPGPACACFSDICRDGQYCHGDTCKDYPMCTDTSGKNPVSECGCGTFESNMLCFTGQYCNGISCENEPFCSADGNNDRCVCSSQAKETIIQPTTYWQGCLPGQNAPTFKGPVYQDLAKDECSEIASIYDYPFVEIPQGDSRAASKPRFCSVVDSIVYYNENYPYDWFSSNNERCNTGNETCLCKTANPEQKVICSKEESCMQELTQCSISNKFGEELSDIAWPDNPNVYGPCTNDDIILNGQTCICGSTFCKKGKKCSGHDGANPTCEYPPACQEGMNAEGCRCNDLETCVLGAGLYCHNSVSEIVTSDTCADHGLTLMSENECRIWAEQKGYGFGSIGAADQDTFASGCSTDFVQGVWWNPSVSSPKQCREGTGAGYWRCVCNTRNQNLCSQDLCQKTDGTEKNTPECACGIADCQPGQYCNSAKSECSSVDICDTSEDPITAECRCGSSQETCQPGEYCYTGLEKCVSEPPCAKQNGLEQNDEACYCKTALCDAGQYCSGDLAECSSDGIFSGSPVCQHQDKTVENPDECWCGSNKCSRDASTGMVCDYSKSECSHFTCNTQEAWYSDTCQCGDNVCVPSSGFQCSSDFECTFAAECKYLYGEGENEVNCKCGDIECNRKEPYCHRDYGCSAGPEWRSPPVSGPLISACDYIDEEQPNMNECLCGTSICGDKNLCKASENTCTPIPDCTHQQPLIPNDGKSCTCDSDGLFCHKGSAICDPAAGICDPLVQCEFSNNNTENSRACTCGSETCTSTTGLICDGSSCYKHEPCLNELPFELNERACQCGETPCVNYPHCSNLCQSGSYCSTKFEHCSDGPGFRGYIPKVDGDCPALDTESILTETMNVTSAQTILSVYGQESFISFGNDCSNCSGGELPAPSRVPPIQVNNEEWCVYAPVCAQTDGINPNDGSCACIAQEGGIFYCHEYQKYCSTGCHENPKCPFTSGISQNEPCACGQYLRPCDDEKPFCIEDLNDGTCFNSTICSEADGLMKTSEDCFCGENKVHCSTGLYCIASEDGGTCLPEGPCQNMFGSEQNSEKCRCGSVDNMCDPDQYCFHDDDNSICDGEAIQICDSKEGFIISTEACWCGAEKCDANQYCHKDSGKQCRDSPRCLYSEGKLQNIEGCDCSGHLTTSEKLYCYSDPGRVSEFPNEVFSNGGYIQKCDLSGQKAPESKKCLCGISKECGDEYCIGGIPFDGDNIGYLYSCEQFKNELGPYAGENTDKLVSFCQQGYDTNTCDYDQTESNNACEWGKKLKEHHENDVKCDDKPACGDYTRSETNPGECWCGDKKCTADTGLTCSALNGGRCGDPMCSDNLAIENIGFKCSCSPNKSSFGPVCAPSLDSARQLCYYPDDNAKCAPTDSEPETGDYLKCGCTDKSLYECTYKDGLIRNLDTSDICACGETVCKPGQYCNAEFSMCGDTTVQSCQYQEGLRVNPTNCLCGTEPCGSGGFYCNPKRECEGTGSCFCHKKLCSDFQDPDSLCDFEGYGAGLVKDAQCAGTTCTIDDLKTCCRECTNEFRVIDGVCTRACTPTISVDDESIPLCQSGSFFPTVINWNATQIKKDASYIAFLSRMSPLYSGYCSSKTCSADDQDLCCLPAQQCKTQDPYNLCVGGTYTGEFTDPDAYCTGIDCEAKDCCAELSCTCENGSPAVGRQCPQVGTPKCIACDTEYWLNGFQCVEATTCDSTEWESIPLGIRNDRRCTDIRICHETQYQTVAPDQTTNRECEYLTVCNETQYISKEKETDTNGNAISNRECEDIIECKENEYETKTPTKTSDGQYKENRECATMTATCDQNHYESQSPTATRDRICSPYNVTCSENEFESSPRTETSDRQCQTLTECNLETQFIAQERQANSNRICQNLTKCQSYSYEFEEKTETTDRKCRTISNCSSGFFIATDYTNTSDRECQEWKTCTTSEYESKEATETTDRECSTCVPFDNLPNYNPTCLGCRFETDCAFNPESLVSDRTKCSGITCKRHILDANHADIIVKVDTWIRFESRRGGGYTFESSGAIANETINTDLNYRYFQVVSSDGFIKINGTELKIQQDCTFGEYKWQGCSVRCGTGQELGFRGQKILDAKHGGAACSDTPKTTTRPCQGQFCPQNCQIEWNTESDKTTPKFGPCNTTCGEEGLQYRNYSIIKEPKNGGNECPTILQQRECIGTDPGYCDCNKNVLDQCQVCGGNGDTCLGCDNVPNSGYEWNACGECMPKGAACSPQAHSKFTKLTKKQEKSKKTKTIITKTVVPIIAGILLFVSAVIGIAVYISKKDKKSNDREIREIFLA